MTPASGVRLLLTALLLAGPLAAAAPAQVSFERLLAADEEPHNWLTYSGAYFSQRYSELDQVTSDNVGDLALQWVYQARVAGGPRGSRRRSSSTA